MTDETFKEGDVAVENSVIRAKYLMDGALTLPEAATKLRDYANHLDFCHMQGWKLDARVDDDYGFISRETVRSEEVSAEQAGGPDPDGVEGSGESPGPLPGV